MNQFWYVCSSMKKSATKTLQSSSDEPVMYRIDPRRKMRVYQSIHGLPAEPRFNPDARPLGGLFPLIWTEQTSADEQSLIDPQNVTPNFFEYRTISDIEDGGVLDDLTASDLTANNEKTPDVAARLAEKYGMLETEHFSDSRGEPVEVWVALGKGISLFTEIADELNAQDPNSDSLRSLLPRFDRIAHEHLGMSSVPGVVFDGLFTAKDEEIPALARKALAQWIETTQNRDPKNFQLQSRLEDGQVRTSVIALNFRAGLGIVLGRYLSRKTNSIRCKNKACRRWFVRTRGGILYGAPTDILRKNCRTYDLRSQVCPWERENRNPVTHP
jgi:hypothetical protein